MMDLRTKIAFAMWNLSNPERVRHLITTPDHLPSLESDFGDGLTGLLDLSFDWALNRDSLLELADIAISTIAANQATDDSDMNSTGPTAQQERHDGGLR